MAEIGVLLRGRESAIVFEAENWKFTEKFLRLVEGDHLVAQFPTGAVLGVWFEEPTDVGAEELAKTIVFPTAEELQSRKDEPVDLDPS